MMALQTKLVKSSHYSASELKILAKDRKKEAHHHKKKISSLKKSLEVSEARSCEQKIEIDNLRSILTRALEEAVERY